MGKFFEGMDSEGKFWTTFWFMVLVVISFVAVLIWAGTRDNHEQTQQRLMTWAGNGCVVIKVEQGGADYISVRGVDTLEHMDEYEEM